MGIADDIQRSEQRLSDAIRFAGLWLAAVDGPIDPREQMEVALAIPHEPEGVSIERMSEAMAGLGEREIAPVLRILRAQRMPRRTEWLIDYFIGIVKADGRVSMEERYALMLLSDLLAAPPELLPQRFEALTGLAFELPPDLSDPDYWARREALAADRRAHRDANADIVSRHRHAEAASARPAEPAPADEAADRERLRREALAVLGLAGSPTPIEIKAAWRRLLRQHHPDRHVADGPVAEAEATGRFQAVQAAYELLAEDPDR